jgi:antitoxin component YwqK of YwqJK toxin-antitoxin module
MMLEACIEFCVQYADDPSVVYKACGDYIVVLKKCDDTTTNEARDNVIDPMHAKFRANKLKVLCIFSSKNPADQVTNIMNTSYFDNIIVYHVNEIIVSHDFDEKDMSAVCAPGIHYFKSLEAAYYYCYNSKTGHVNYTGKFISWYDGGQKQYEYEIVNGQIHGKFVGWSASGQKNYECEFVNGKLHGKYLVWYDSNKPYMEYEYINGHFSGSVRLVHV